MSCGSLSLPISNIIIQLAIAKVEAKENRYFAILFFNNDCWVVDGVLYNVNTYIMINAPLFSVITLSSNSIVGIGRTLESLKSQTFKNFEVIFQDAASSDGTVIKIKQNLDQFENASLVSETDTGIYDGLNKALERVNAEFVCVLHADDVFASDDILEMVALKLKESRFDLAYGDVLFYSKANSSHIVRRWISGNFVKKKLFLGWMPPHTSLFIKKEIFNNFGYYRTDLKVSADYDFILRILKSDELEITYFMKPIVKMSIGGASTSGLRSLIIKLKEDFIILSHYYGMFAFIPLIMKRISKIRQFFIL